MAEVWSRWKRKRKSVSAGLRKERDHQDANRFYVIKELSKK